VIVYFDTSALLKRYVIEAGSDAMAALWKDASAMATSQILYAEVAASFARKRREEPANAAVLDQALQTFRKDWVGLHRIAVDNDVNRHVDDLLIRHPLRGADAIHLASALVLRDLAKTTSPSPAPTSRSSTPRAPRDSTSRRD
jgi:predicted nucleic acid-binding protein